ncbi:MAG TPA: HAD-IA family hydrolase [Patescibacteria group bacterium]|nr:HAD-IA family hydrolase [Patescibacteria group bacterium]
MAKVKYFSFDLQGVLSASGFSDYFWLEQLPLLYANKHGVALQQAKTELRTQFAAMGKYDTRYYDDAFWARQLGFKTAEVLRGMPLQPSRNETLFEFIRAQPLPVVIISTTTRVFLNYELGDKKPLFEQIYSCVDTFGIGGKTPAVYQKVAQELGVQPDEILHIGDDPEMDVRNACAAGVRALAYDANDADLIKILRSLS